MSSTSFRRVFFSHSEIFFFSLHSQSNVADQYPSIVEALLGRLATYYEDTVYPYYPGFDFEANPGNHDGAWKPWVD